MKKEVILFFFIAFAVIFITSACDRDDPPELNDCKSSQVPEISRSFVFSAVITYNDGAPYEGPVHFKVKKEYCDGTISGEYYLANISSDAQGKWFSGMVYTYKYANELDKVFINFSWATKNSRDFYEFIQSIKYSQVKDETGNIMIEYTIKLPWLSP